MSFYITTCPFEVNKQIMQLHYLFHYRIASEQVSQIKLMYLETFNYCLTSDHSPGFKWLSFMIHKLELKVRLFRKDFLVSSNYPKKTNKRICLSSKNEFICTFFWENSRIPKSFWNYLTFRKDFVGFPWKKIVPTCLLCNKNVTKYFAWTTGSRYDLICTLPLKPNYFKKQHSLL